MSRQPLPAGTLGELRYIFAALRRLKSWGQPIHPDTKAGYAAMCKRAYAPVPLPGVSA